MCQTHTVSIDTINDSNLSKIKGRKCFWLSPLVCPDPAADSLTGKVAESQKCLLAPSVALPQVLLEYPVIFQPEGQVVLASFMSR